MSDSDRPYPGEVTPGANWDAPPSDAVVLFTGKDLSKWTQRGRGGDSGKMVDAKWKVVDGAMEIVHGTGDLISRARFGDCQYPRGIRRCARAAPSRHRAQVSAASSNIARY